jgi:hypothetical protein
MRTMIAQMSVEQARQLLQKVEAESAGAPPDRRPLVDAMKRLLLEHIAKGDRP